MRITIYKNILIITENLYFNYFFDYDYEELNIKPFVQSFKKI